MISSRTKYIGRNICTLIGGSLLLLIASSCSTVNREELVQGARSLVPPHSSVLREHEGDCVELAPSPSCVHIYFLHRAVRLRLRMEAIDDQARASGWTRTSREILPGGSQLRYQRGDVGAVVNLWMNQRTLACREKQRSSCADSIMVEGIE